MVESLEELNKICQKLEIEQGVSVDGINQDRLFERGLIKKNRERPAKVKIYKYE